MQTLKFIRRSHGVSKRGNDYDIAEVSDGLASFALSLDVGVGEQLKELSEGEDFEAEVHVSSGYNGLRGRIVNVQV